MRVPFRRLGSGTILVDVAKPAADRHAVAYARVSCHDQHADLDRQVYRLTGWATATGLDVGQLVTEDGSGLNGKRPKLGRMLSDPSATVIVVEHRNRLARFGVEQMHAPWPPRAAGSWSVATARPPTIRCATCRRAHRYVCSPVRAAWRPESRIAAVPAATQQPEPVEAAG